MTLTRTRRAARGVLILAAALTILPVALAHAAPQAAPATTADELEQTIDPNQAQGTGQVVLDDGHIDFGPTLNTGDWIVQIHDDTSAPSYWRMPADVVAQVNDGSKLTVPENDAYAFLGLEPGAEAWVIPQVREPGVIWAGWNTQEPNVLDALSMGTTLAILGVDGPGSVSVYLQSGNFGDPDPLWSTHDAFPQSSWIELNTHTHANWVFSDPGVYLVEVEFSGSLADGTEVSAHDTLRFAVGDETDPQEAFAAQIDETELAPGEAGAGEADSAAGVADGAGSPNPQAGGSDGGMSLLVGTVGGVIGAAIVIALIVIVIARSGAKKRQRQLAWQRAQDEAIEQKAGTR